MDKSVRQVLGGDTSAISTLRCLKLYLERMGSDFQNASELHRIAGKGPAPPPPHLQAPFSGPVCGGVDADIGPGADVTETMENRKFLALRENLIGFSILCPMRLAWVAGGSSRSHPLPPPGLKLFEHSSCLYAALVFQANSLLLALYQQGCCRLA